MEIYPEICDHEDYDEGVVGQGPEAFGWTETMLLQRKEGSKRYWEVVRVNAYGLDLPHDTVQVDTVYVRIGRWLKEQD